MITVPLKEVCYVSMGQAPDGASYNDSGEGFPLIAGAGDFGELSPEPKKYTSEPTRVSQVDDIILCIRATIGDLNWSDKAYCLGRGVAGLRPRVDKLDRHYLWHWLASQKDYLFSQGTGSTFKQISRSTIDDLSIPIPPLPEQKRIAAILDKADSIRRKRQEAVRLTEELLRSVFLEMFGDPVTNPNGWKVSRLIDVASVQSGATPSTENEAYWNGNIPWVSPKDMKKVELYDSIDHVSDLAFKGTNLKKIEPLSILLVVRGMILAHTVPIAVNKCHIAINQDIKAFSPKSNILPEFLLWNLLVQHNHILSKVATAAHGTKRLVMTEVEKLSVLVPPKELQNKFVEMYCKVTNVINNNIDSLITYDTLFNSLLQRAFRGNCKDMKSIHSEEPIGEEASMPWQKGRANE